MKTFITLCIVAGSLITLNNLLMRDYKCTDFIPHKREKKDLNLYLGRWDKSRSYKIVDHVIVGSDFVELSKEYVVSLASQSNLERLDSIVELTEQWTGPISVALFISGEEELVLTQYFIEYLRKCFVIVRKRINFHFVYPNSNSRTKTNYINLDDVSYDCNDLKAFHKYLMSRANSTRDWYKANLYPQNHLRNVARKNCQTEFTFLVDIDIVPSKNIAEKLNKFLRTVKCEKKCVFATLTFEIATNASMPISKGDLKVLVDKGLARPFHIKRFSKNQAPGNASRWLLNYTDTDDIYISYKIDYKLSYEPFYISKDDVPEFDERFVGFGYTRNTQVYELVEAGYEIYIVSPIFTSHWGFTEKIKRPRDEQINSNRKLFAAFKEEVKARYSKPNNKTKLKIKSPNHGI